ncbi:hypothetical protein KFL_000020500 [Klebsormidium nitens]|uniref:Uncharacterized protein n=1 Tax=Klebsormidium nitens TaxID=105231 RepID=A0A1Y1HPC3_KLENI|nr:hypothetical protein KFL_000020500 [Klebsormidium nitens]|eukprot:GAQ77688.1 hypothetical protein KFL_000020500 [Klebsormidium nitens]
MASLALKSSASAFSGLALQAPSARRPANTKIACRDARTTCIRAGEQVPQEGYLFSRRSLSLAAAAAAVALANQPAALAARRGGGKVEEAKAKLPEDDPKLSALEKRAMVKARQLEELKAKVAKEKAKAGDSAPAEIQSNVATVVNKAKEAPAAVADVAKEVVEAVPTPSAE